MKKAITFSILALAASSALAHGPADGRAVMIGQDGADFDACGGYGEITGLNPDGDNFLAVRAGPTTQASKVDELHQSDPVWLCDATADGEWIGIVYGESSGPDRDCQVGENLSKPVAYHGPCRSGWVSSRYVTLIAG